MPGAATADHFRLLKMTWKSGFCTIMDCYEWNRKKVTFHHQELFNYELYVLCGIMQFFVDDLSSPVRDKESELCVMRERNHEES